MGNREGSSPSGRTQNILAIKIGCRRSNLLRNKFDWLQPVSFYSYSFGVKVMSFKDCKSR